MKDAIRERLMQIEEAHGGRLTPADVVADGQDPTSPLHDQFEWDTSKAAYAHWLDQARTLIRSVQVVVLTETSLVKSVGYVRDPSIPGHDQGYLSVTRLRAAPELAREALLSEFSRIATLLDRARSLAAALGAESDIERLMEGVAGVRMRIAEAPARHQ